MGKQLFLTDDIIRNGNLSVSTFHPSHPAEKLRNIWTTYGWRSRYGSGSGWGRFVVSASNKYIDFNEGGGDLVAILDEETYDADTLAAHIKAKLDTAGGLTYTVTYSDNSNKFTIAATGGFTLLWHSGDNHANSAYALLGYADEDDTGTDTYIADSRRIHSEEYAVIESSDGSSITCKACALCGLNLTSGYQALKLERWTGAAWEFVANFTYNSSTGRACCIFTEKSSFKWRIYLSDRENSAGYITIGVPLLGNYKELSRGFEYGFYDNVDDTSFPQYSKEGYLNIVTGFERILKGVVYVVLSEDATKLRDLYAAVLRRYPFIFIGDSENDLATMEYVIFTSPFYQRQLDAYFVEIRLSWVTVK